MEEELRIGVFVCHCGVNIGGFLDVPALTEYAKKLPGVAYAERNLYTCSSDGTESIKKAIKEYNLNRVVVASCTPRTHAPLFKRKCNEAGVNPYLFELVNIRDQCSWVHMHEPELATEKAKDLIRMGVAKVALLEPGEDISIDVEPSSLVIGAGISGMTAALNLADQGFDIFLVDKGEEMGGILRSLYKLYPTDQHAEDVLEPIIGRIKEHDKIEIYTSSTIKNVDGYIGNFEVTIDRNGEKISKKVGTIIVATGAKELKPLLYGYGAYNGVITQLELEKLLKENKSEKLSRVIMIQCVGSRGQIVPYCSRVCCMVAIKNAIIIKDMYPETEVCILHDGIRSYGKYEDYYRRAREMGIRFYKYSREKPLKVTEEKGKLNVKFCNELTGADMEYDAEKVVLSTPLVQNPDAEEISKMLKVPLGSEDKFFFEAHSKLRPLDFATDGIYLCGTTRGPANIRESIEQALGAASRASIPMWNRKHVTEAINSVIDTDKCVGCSACISNCPFKAIREREDGKSEIISALCHGCGTCVATCSQKAIDQHGFRDEELKKQIEACFEEAVT